MNEEQPIYAGDISVEDALYKIYGALMDIKRELEDIRIAI